MPDKRRNDEGGEGKVIAGINRFRKQQGESPLVADEALTALAQDQAARMAKGGYFDHRGFATRIPAEEWSSAGEVIYKATPGSQFDTPPAAVASWRGSSTHRAIILGGHELVGIGQALDKRRRHSYWVAVLGTR